VICTLHDLDGDLVVKVFKNVFGGVSFFHHSIEPTNAFYKSVMDSQPHLCRPPQSDPVSDESYALLLFLGDITFMANDMLGMLGIAK